MQLPAPFSPSFYATRELDQANDSLDSAVNSYKNIEDARSDLNPTQFAQFAQTTLKEDVQDDLRVAAGNLTDSAVHFGIAKPFQFGTLHDLVSAASAVRGALHTVEAAPTYRPGLLDVDSLRAAFATVTTAKSQLAG